MRQSSDSRMVLLAHAAGINAFLASCAACPVELQALNHEPDAWQAWDAIAVFLMVIVGSTTHHELQHVDVHQLAVGESVEPRRPVAPTALAAERPQEAEGKKLLAEIAAVERPPDDDFVDVL
jgi:acyl-homoserine lactone acylase PvdQ